MNVGEERRSSSGGEATFDAVVLFDDKCNLCNRTIQFIIRRDPRGRVRFATLDSDAARTRLNSGEPLPNPPDSIVLLEAKCAYVRSTAALRIARKLRFPWPLLYGFIIVPRPLRDRIYDWIARNRYRWFGRRDACMVPTPELRARFLNG